MLPIVLNETPPRNLIAERRATESVWKRVLDVIGQILAFIPTILGKIGSAIARVVTMAATAFMRLLIEGPLWLFEKITGVSTAHAREAIGTALRAGFNAIYGFCEGVLRAPAGVIGAAWGFLSNIFSGEFTKSWGRFAALWLEPVFTVLASGLGPFVFAFKRFDDAVHPPRPPTAEERALLLRLYPASFVDRLIIHPENSWFRAISAHGGYTLENDIYLVDSRTQWQGHEAVHSLQYEDTPGGPAPFLGRYFAQILGDMIAGRSQDQAYENTSAEEEALRLFSPPG
jgi:hypothetical protein